MEEEESDPRTRAQRTRAKTLSLVTICLEWIWDLERLWFYWIVSCIDCTSSCIECEVWKTWMPWIVVVGGYLYSQPPKQSLGRVTVDGHTRESGAPPDIVRCASHVTQPLGFWQFWPLELWQLGPPNSPVPHRTVTVHCLVRLLALLWLCANCPRTVQLSGDRWSRPLRLGDIALLAHRTVRWPIGQSGEL
jgi:hypothetical protein